MTHRSMPSFPEHLQKLAESFTLNADNAYRESSPLYDHLARQVAEDAEILALALNADQRTYVSTLFFGAVHYLLMDGQPHLLAEFYPDLTPNPRPPEEAYPHFRTFCLEHSTALKSLLQLRRLQTNEVARCTSLLPAFGVIAARAGRPLALVEIGTSAGLNLLWDRYGYSYGSGQQAGDPASPVQLTCAVRGEHPLPISNPMPQVTHRVGLDLSPIDLRSDDAVRWLMALIWPEQAQRRALLNSAISVARRDPPRLLAGDALSLLPRVLDEALADGTLVVFHSFTVNQFSHEGRDRLDSILTGGAITREIFCISLEWLSDLGPLLELSVYRRNGTAERELLARCHFHGAWIEWLGGS